MNLSRVLSYFPIPMLIILAILFVLLWFLPDLTAWLERRPDEAWARVRSSGVIVFATDASYPPFEGLGGDGVFYGLDVDVAREIAKRIGVMAEFRNVGMDGLYDVLQAGQADASISALPIDPARAGRWKYSHPYFDAGLTLITLEGSHLDSEQALPGHTVAVVLGSEGDAWLRQAQRRAPGIVAARFDSAREASDAVGQGRAEAAILDGVTARQLAARVAAQLTSEPYAIAVWGDSVDLLAAIDRALAEMEADGTLQRIIDEWMDREA